MLGRGVYWIAAALVWALALAGTLACRGLFWDGAAFLAILIDTRDFHLFFYPARAHVGAVTQAPVLLALAAGLRDTHLLAMIQSAALFGLPAGLYHLALARTAARAILFAAVLAVLALVWLPTSFFIIGEYNALYAAATAAMAIVLTSAGRWRRDGLLLCLIAALCLRSYEAMVYLGPLLAAACLWWTLRLPRGEAWARLLGGVAALAFLGGTAVAAATLIEYWTHPHFVLVRAAVLDFWQNLQFVVPVAGLALFALASLARPGWLATRAPAIFIGVIAVLLAATPFIRYLSPGSMIFPPSHYVARQAAGMLLSAILAAMWLLVAWRQPPLRLLVRLGEAAVGRRLAGALCVLLVAASVPDMALTGLWLDYIGGLRGVVQSRTGFVRADVLPLQHWPQRLFLQEWTLPALTALLRGGPGQAVVLPPAGYASNMPFDPRCGDVPRLSGLGWR